MQNELGFYQTNGKIYTNKITAILDAQATLADISWNYFDTNFKQYDWTKEPELSIDELYKLKAQQLRAKYDYIVIMLSGGADSTNIVKSFLKNNIHVDEIIAGAPMSGLKGWDWNSKDKHVENTISETKFALFPLLEEIAEKYPKVKITVNDYFEDILNFETDKWIYDCQDWVNPAVGSRASLDKHKHLVDLADSGKRIAVLWGIDKPVLRYAENGDIYTVINDLGVNNAHPPFQTPYPNVDRILFYWTPDFPEILIKQSHIVAKYIHKKENFWLAEVTRKFQSPKYWPTPEDKNLTDRPDYKGDYQRGIVPAIYPTTYGNVFQCQKSRASFMPEQHHWIQILHKESRLCQLLESDFKLFYTSINPKYLKPTGTGFRIFQQAYRIGHISQFMEIAL
jgi:hypothetical protein